MIRTASILLCLACLGSRALGADAPRNEGETRDRIQLPFQLRKVFVREDQLEQFAAGCLPVPVDEFQRRLEVIYRQLHRQVFPDASVTRANYHGVIHPSGSIIGTAELAIKHDGTLPSMISLEGLDVALANPRWKDAPDEKVLLGAWNSSKSILIVKHSGTLLFDWSVSGRSRRGEVAYELALAKCPVNRIVLVAPENLDVRFEKGIVSSGRIQAAPIAQSPSIGDKVTDMMEDAGATWTQWQVEMGPSNSNTITTVPRSTADDRVDAIYRKELKYNLSQRGIELSAEIQLERFSPAARVVTLDCSRKLVVTSIRFDGQRVPWQLLEDPETDVLSVHINLVDVTPRQTGVITITAISPLHQGELTTLPDLFPRGMRWQQSSVSIVVPDILQLNRLVTEGCHQVGAVPTLTPQRGRMMQFYCRVERATCRLEVATVSHLVDATVRNLVDFGRSSLAARVTASLSATRGELFRLTLPINGLWTIDTVRLQPNDMLSDWELGKSNEGQQQIEVRLRSALRQGTDIQVQIDCHRPMPASGFEFTAQELQVVEVPDATKTVQWLGIRGESSNTLEPLGNVPPERTELVSWNSADHGDGELGSVPYRVFRLGDRARGLRFRVSSQNPSFGASIRIACMIEPETLVEEFRITCKPESGQVGQLQIRISQARSQSLDWKVAGDETSQITASRVVLDDESGFEEGGETWRVVLHQPREEPFEIVAQRRFRRDDSTLLSFAAVIDAESQDGEVSIGAVRGVDYHVTNQSDLKAVPQPSRETAGVAKVALGYQFDPLRQVRLGMSPIRVHRPGPRGSQKQGWVELSKCTTVLGSDGGAVHEISYVVNHTGLGHVFLRMPKGCVVHTVEADGQDVKLNDLGEGDVVVRVPLPGRDRSTLTVRFGTRREPWRFFDEYRMDWPDINVPILQQQWQVAMPSGYRQVGASGAIDLEPRTDLQLNQRLFGSFARTRSERTNERTSDYQWRGLVTESSSSAIRFANNSLMLCFGWLTFAIVTFLTLHVTKEDRRFPTARFLLVAIGVCGGVVQVMPLPVLPLAVGAFWAFVVAAIHLVVRQSMVSPTSTAISEKSTVVPRKLSNSASAPRSSSVVSGAIAIILLMTESSLAAEIMEPPLGTTADPDSTHFPVFHPLNEDGDVKGGYVYVPEPLYARLYRDGNPRGHHIVDALIHRARYQARLAWNPSVRRNDLVDFTAIYAASVFAERADVQLELDRDQVDLKTHPFLVDGERIKYSWDDAGGTVTLRGLKRGTVMIQAKLRPSSVSDDARNQVELSIPRISDTEIAVDLPNDSVDMRIANHHGFIPVESSAGQIRAVLGPTDRLAISWPLRRTAAPSPLAEVEQVAWFDIQPGAVFLELRFVVRPVEGMSQQIEIAADSRLRYLGTEGMDYSIRPMAAVDGMRTYRFEMHESRGNEFTLQAKFLIRDTRGLSSFLVPEVRVQNAETISSWLAFTHDPSIQINVASDGQLELIPIGEFIYRWSDTFGNPSLAYRAPTNNSAVSVTAEYARARVSVSQNIELIHGTNWTSITASSDLTAAAGAVFQHRIAVPPDFQVDRVMISEGKDVDATSEVKAWSVGDEGWLNIFFDHAIKGTYRLDVHGRVRSRFDETIQVSDFAVQQATVESARIWILRSSDVFVETEKSTGLIPVDPRLVSPPTITGDGRTPILVSVSDWVGQTPWEMSIRIHQNKVRFEAETRARLTQHDDDWLTEVRFKIDVQSGYLDMVRFEGPRGWGEDLTMEPPVDFRRVESADSTRTQFELLFPEPIRTTCEYIARGSFDGALNQLVRLADITLLGTSRVNTLVVLPKSRSGRPIEWDVRGMVPSENDPNGVTEVQRYRVVDDHYRAVARRSTPLGDNSHVRLAEYRLWLAADGAYSGAAIYDLEPGGTNHCGLDLPPDCELIEARIAGRPAAAWRRDDGLWAIQLPSSVLSQRLVVTFSGRHSANRNRFSADRVLPVLNNMEIRRSLLTIRSFDGSTITGYGHIRSCDRNRHLKLQTESVLSMMERNLEYLRNNGLAEITSWQDHWRNLIVISESRLGKLSTEGKAEDDDSSHQPPTGLRERLAELKNQLDDLSETTPGRQSGLPTDEVAFTSTAVERAVQSTHRFVISDAPGAVVLSIQSAVSPGHWRRGVAALFFWTVAILAGLVRPGRILPFVGTMPWGSGLMIVLGIIAWFWLTPRLIGIVLFGWGAIGFANGLFASRRSRLGAPEGAGNDLGPVQE